MTLSISSRITNHNLDLPSRHLVRWIGEVPFEYWRDIDGWHVQAPNNDKALVFQTAERLSAFWVGMAMDFNQMEPESNEDNRAARQHPEGF